MDKQPFYLKSGSLLVLAASQKAPALLPSPTTPSGPVFTQQKEVCAKASVCL